MISKITPEFRQRLAALPAQTQRLAYKAYRLWKANPSYPSIQFKPLEGHPFLWSARVGIHYRALAHREGELVVWVWIGHHAEYDKLQRR